MNQEKAIDSHRMRTSRLAPNHVLHVTSTCMLLHKLAILYGDLNKDTVLQWHNCIITHLKLEPRWWLVSRSIHRCSSQSLLAVRGVSRRPLVDEATKILDHSTRGSEATDAEREEDPATSVRGLGRILTQLFADLTVDFISVGGRGWSSRH